MFSWKEEDTGPEGSYSPAPAAPTSGKHPWACMSHSTPDAQHVSYRGGSSLHWQDVAFPASLVHNYTLWPDFRLLSQGHFILRGLRTQRIGLNKLQWLCRVPQPRALLSNQGFPPLELQDALTHLTPLNPEGLRSSEASDVLRFLCLQVPLE